MKNSLNEITKNFILNEGVAPPFQVWIQSLQENLSSLRQVNELRRVTRRMDEQIKKLEEEVIFLQENKNE